MRFPSLCVGALITAAAACGGDGSGPTNNGNPGGIPGSTSSSIAVANNSFDPSATTVTAGTTVTWTWAAGAVAHNVTFADGTKSATQATGTFTRAFAAAGSFPYQCTLHAGMSGTVTVR